MLRKLTFASIALLIFAHSICFAVQPYRTVLKNGEAITLVMVEDNKDEIGGDLELGLKAFCGAFIDATKDELIEHFGLYADIRGYYKELIRDDDIVPFRFGELIWIRAFIADKLVGFMTLLPKFKAPETVYVSTMAVAPNSQKLGIGKVMLASIKAHWFPSNEEIDLVVRKINYQALPFYSRLGFVDAPDIESEYLGNPKHCKFLRSKNPSF